VVAGCAGWAPSSCPPTSTQSAPWPLSPAHHRSQIYSYSSVGDSDLHVFGPHGSKSFPFFIKVLSGRKENLQKNFFHKLSEQNKIFKTEDNVPVGNLKEKNEKNCVDHY
jgi:hypothetical protein